MGGKPSSNFTDPLPESSPIPLTFLQQKLDFPPPSPLELYLIYYWHCLKIDQYVIQNSSKRAFETSHI